MMETQRAGHGQKWKVEVDLHLKQRMKVLPILVSLHELPTQSVLHHLQQKPHLLLAPLENR